MASEVSCVTVKQEPESNYDKQTALYGFHQWDQSGNNGGVYRPADIGRLTYLHSTTLSSTSWSADNVESSSTSDSSAQHDPGHMDDLFKYDEESDSEEESNVIAARPEDADNEEQLTWTDQSFPTTIPPFSAEEGPNFSGFTTFGASRAVDFFHLFFPEDLYKQAQIETNNFAEYYQESKRDLGRDWWEWCDETWEPVESKQEIRVFIGICIAMAVHTLPDPRDYWSKKKNLGNSTIAKSSMSMSHFAKIMHYFCLNNPWRDPEKIANLERRAKACSCDPLYKVSNNLLENVKSSCINLYKPHQDLVMQELTGSAGHKSGRKTNDWKLIALQDANTRYVCNIQWYRDQETSEYTNQNLTYKNAVNALVKNLEGKGHCVYVDYLFISPRMACRLNIQDIHIITNHSDWPSNIINLDQDLKIGTSKTVKYNQVTATVWRGKKLKRCLSTLNDGLMQSVTQKVCNPTTGQNTIETVLCPTVISKHMAITDKLPRLILSQAPILQKLTNMWWKRLVWLLIDICINNAHVMWSASNLRHLTHSEFAMEVASELIFGPRSEEPPKRLEPDSKNASTSHELQTDSCLHSQESVICAPTQPTFHYVVNHPNLLAAAPHAEDQPESSSDTELTEADLEAEHCVVKFPGRGRNCRQCSIDDRRTQSGRRRDTQFGCLTCGLNLCRSGCFVRYHEANGYKINPLTLTKTKLLYEPLPLKRKKLSF